MDLCESTKRKSDEIETILVEENTENKEEMRLMEKKVLLQEKKSSLWS